MDSAHSEFSSVHNQKLQDILRVGLRNPKFALLPNVKASHKIQEEREWFLPPDGRCSTAIQGKMADGHADTHGDSTHQNSEQWRSIAGVTQMEIKVQNKFY